MAFEALVELLEANDPETREASFGWFYLGDDEARRIAAALERNDVLRRLFLPYNSITDAGAAHLADAVRATQTLSQLDLGCNLITDVGARALADALTHNHSLRSLELWGNKLGDAGAEYVADALETNECLMRLNLLGCRVGDKGAHKLAVALRENEKAGLRHLVLGSNNISGKGAKALLTVMHRSDKHFEIQWSGVRYPRSIEFDVRYLGVAPEGMLRLTGTDRNDASGMAALAKAFSPDKSKSRGAGSLLIVQEMMAGREPDEEMHEAALAIQGPFRGRLTRSRAQKQHRAATAIQTQTRGIFSRRRSQREQNMRDEQGEDRPS